MFDSTFTLLVKQCRLEKTKVIGFCQKVIGFYRSGSVPECADPKQPQKTGFSRNPTKKPYKC